MKPRSSHFVQGATVLAVATIGAKIIGALYRIPLTNILGAEGMGVYQLIFPLYALVLTLSSGALPSAIAILTSRSMVSGSESSAKKWVSSSMTVVLLGGAIFALLMIALAYPLSLLQQNEDAMLGYFALAPAVFFVSGIAVLRGWFQGKRNMTPTAVSNITEAVSKLAIGLTLAVLFKVWGIKYAVFGALIGVTASEIVTFLVLYVVYKKQDGKLFCRLPLSEAKKEYRNILRLSVPMAVCGVIANFTQFVDSVAVVSFLTGAVGLDASIATADYGLFSGPVSSLISLPVVLGVGLSVAIVPAVAGDKEARNLSGIRQKSTTAIKLAIVVGIPFAVFFMVAAEGIISLLYPAFSARELTVAANLLRITAVSTFTLLCGQILVAVLQALGEIKRPIINYSIAAAVKIVLDFALMPVLQIYGVAIASVASALTAFVLNALSLVWLTGSFRNVSRSFFTTLFASAVIGGVMLFFVYTTAGGSGALIAGVLGATLYVVLMLALGGLSGSELKSLPFGDQIYKLSKQIRFWD